jgi:hypothetical protein
MSAEDCHNNHEFSLCPHLGQVGYSAPPFDLFLSQIAYQFSCNLPPNGGSMKESSLLKLQCALMDPQLPPPAGWALSSGVAAAKMAFRRDGSTCIGPKKAFTWSINLP